MAEGVANLSMPAVARRLGVGHSTLYRYVHDRDDLILAALDLAVREFDWPAADLGWRELLTALVDALWSFLERHPGMAEAIQSVPGMPAPVVELVATYIAHLRAEGLDPHDAAVALDLIADLTVATEIAMRGLGELFDTPRGRRSLREVYVATAGLQGRGWLDDKLAVLLDGLASRVGDPPTDPPAEPAPPPSSPRAARPDRAAISAAGRLIGRRAGLAAVTLRAVAAELGCAPADLRHEIGDRDGIVVAMLDEVAAEIDLPEPAPDPRAELLALATAVHRVLRPEPWAVRALAVDNLVGPLMLPVVERLFAALAAGGVPVDRIVVASRVLWEQIFGAAIGRAGADTFAARVADSADTPQVAAVAAGTTAADLDPARVGIEIVVDGVLRHFAPV